ncbi:MAG: hypothetical protein ACYSO7_06285 [Planctomycetota bacterium]|jgi:hypothetical protein
MGKSGIKSGRDIEVFINESAELAEARENGVDLWALWHNLQRTPAERLRRHQIALDTRHMLQKAKKL